jgi:diaminohydroxyphosphoribosylaminopyrimidine deaminase/5-amino-6-(5-phosphoribosylamino)uracil reductase
MISPFERRTLASMLKMAATHAANTRPNPPVIAAILKDDTVIHIGRHEGPGTPHAEIAALRAVGPDAKGTTLIVTLEPCSHWGANPPCTDAIIQSGVRRVIYPITDPNPLVRKNPATQRLQNAGIEVCSGILETQAALSNAEFLTHISLNRSYVTAKVAASLDGKTALITGESKYISGPNSLQYVHTLRQECDGICVGIGTVLADNPRLTVRNTSHATPKNPKKIILDSSGNTPLDSHLFLNTNKDDVIIVTLNSAPQKNKDQLSQKATLISLDGPSLKNQWIPILTTLKSLGIYHLLLEGGTQVMSSAIDQGVVDRFIMIQSPILIGGQSLFSPYQGLGAKSLDQAIQLQHVRYKRAGRDMIISGHLNDPATLLRRV